MLVEGILAVFRDHFRDHSSYPWDQGVDVGGQMGSNLAIFDPKPLPLTRARAYNDLQKMPFY